MVDFHKHFFSSGRVDRLFDSATSVADIQSVFAWLALSLASNRCSFFSRPLCSKRLFQNGHAEFNPPRHRKLSKTPRLQFKPCVRTFIETLKLYMYDLSGWHKRIIGYIVGTFQLGDNVQALTELAIEPRPQYIAT